jgi:hypothetical protein
MHDFFRDVAVVPVLTIERETDAVPMRLLDRIGVVR